MIVARKLPWRRILGDIGRPFLAYLVWAALVSVAHVAGAEWLAFPALPISVVAATLGILLSFRNNSAYDRWWEARTLWGGVVNQSRTFARQLLTFLPAAEMLTSSRSTARTSSGTPLSSTCLAVWTVPRLTLNRSAASSWEIA